METFSSTAHLARRAWRAIALTAVVLTALLSGCASQSALRAEDPAQVIAQLTVQSDAWDKAIVRQDRVAIESNMADDFRNIDSNARVMTRRQFVDELVSSDLEIDPYTVEDFDVRLYGDMALVSGRTAMTGRFQGEPFTTHYRYIDIYARRDGEWKIISVQTTRHPKP